MFFIDKRSGYHNRKMLLIAALFVILSFSIALLSPLAVLADHKSSHNPAPQASKDDKPSPAASDKDKAAGSSANTGNNSSPASSSNNRPSDTPAASPANKKDDKSDVPVITAPSTEVPKPSPAPVKSTPDDKTDNKASQPGTISPPSPAPVAVPAPEEPKPAGASKPEFATKLQRGSSGPPVRQLQESLKQFPDLYPAGLVTGHYGPLTEGAVKRFQKNNGLGETGIVDRPTQDKLNELQAALRRKESVKIFSINPDSAALGDSLEITGQGFTTEGNAIFVRGQIIATALSSDDGVSLKFILPSRIPCLPGQACPLKVVNGNGISNAKPVKILEAIPVTEPPIAEPPTPTTTPVQLAPTVISLTPVTGPVGTVATLAGTGFTPQDNAINFGGLDKAVTSLPSVDGVSLSFTIPAVSSCPPVQSCSVSVSNKNGTSNVVSFTLTQTAPPVLVIAPNGSEQIVQGTVFEISWRGGIDQTRVALLQPEAASGTDLRELIIGWLPLPGSAQGPLHWDGRQVCSLEQTTCWPVAAGNYKILIVSEDEFGQLTLWHDAVGTPGNWDISDEAFSLLPAAVVSVVSPNGGERLALGSTTSLTWNATSILSKTVNLNLFKGGVLYRPIAANVSQGQITGLFSIPWVVPADLPAAADYAVEVVDATNPALRDTSDSLFSVVVPSTITALAPNGGNLWVQGFQGTVRWSASNLAARAVDINLWKGGSFYRNLASNVPQTYSWSTQNYASGTFSYVLIVPADLPVGTDYTIEVTEAGNPAVHDSSDGPFQIMILPDPVTYRGRLVDANTKAPLVNIWLNLQGSYIYTNSNGEFTATKSTAGIISGRTVYASWPQCYMLTHTTMIRNPDDIYTWQYVFDLKNNPSTPIATEVIDQGDILMWPATGLNVISDTPVRFVVNYPEDGAAVMSGSATLKPVYKTDKTLALNYQLRVVLTDAAGQTIYSPNLLLSLENGCVPKTLSFIGGRAQWEPYTITTGPTATTYYTTVGKTFSLSLAASGGVGGYTWSLLSGSMPAGFSLDSVTGVISGTPTTSGTYEFAVKVTDSNGVVNGKLINLQINAP